jgi:hypothetical protein
MILESAFAQTEFQSNIRIDINTLHFDEFGNTPLVLIFNQTDKLILWINELFLWYSIISLR